MISARRIAPFAATLGLLCAAATAQEPKPKPAYPTTDILSPFRNPQEICAPPDELFAKLRTMRRIADAPGAPRSFGPDGREVIDDDTWRLVKKEVDAIGLDAGMLANLMRVSRNADERGVAFYAGFYCANEDYVFNLISHIPGEPERKIRERAYPRAVEFLRAHLGRTFGELSADEQQIVLRDMPKPGSPAAEARGIKRLPQPADTLFSINLTPFFQLLDLDHPLDQAQGLWFLGECFAVRRDLALAWLEPALPRVRQILGGDDRDARTQAIALLAAIGPAGAELPAVDADAATLDAFADRAIRAMFPPIRRLSEGLVLLLPSPDRDAIVAAGREALDGDRIGELARGKGSDGQYWFGFRVDRVPETLAVLGIPKGAVVLRVNGVPVRDGRSLLQAIGDQFFVREVQKDGPPRMRPTSQARLFVEMRVGDHERAMEYRVQ